MLNSSVRNDSDKKTNKAIFRRSLVDDLPFEDIIDDVIVYADGSVGCAYELSPIYVDSMDMSQLIELEKTLCGFIYSIDTSTCTQIVWRKTGRLDALDAHMSIVQTADPIIQLMSSSRQNFWERRKMQKRVFGISIQIWFRKKYERKLKQNFNSIWGVDSGQLIDSYIKEQVEIGAEFKKYTERIVSSLRNITPVRRMNTQEIFTSIWEYFCGDESSAPDYKYEMPLKDRFSGVDVKQDFGYITIGNSHSRIINVMSVRDVPEYSKISLISHLLDLPMEFTLVMNIGTMSQGAIRSKIDKQRRRYESYITQVWDPAAHKRAEDIAILLRDLEESTNQIVKFEMMIIIPGQSLKELDDKVKFVKEAGTTDMNGVRFEKELAAIWDIFIAAAPGYCSCGSTHRDIMVKTVNIADFLPVFGSVRSAEKSVMLLEAPYNTLYGYDPFDSRLPAPHALIFGGTGKGKSFTANLLILSASSQNPLIFIVDKGGSYKKLTQMLGGSYIDLSQDGFAFNPLEGKENWPKNSNVIVQIMSECVRSSPDAPISDQQDTLVRRWMQTLFEAFKGKDRDPTFSDAYDVLDKQLLYSTIKEPNLAQVQSDMRIAFSKWTRIGSRNTSVYAKYLDNPKSTIPLDRDMVTFDLQGVNMSKAMMSVVFLTINNIIMSKATSDQYSGRQKLIVFDEVWALLASDEGANFIGELYRTMRKYRAMVMAISQNIDDFANSSIANALLTNTYQMIVLGQGAGANGERIAEVLGLNNSERLIIENLKMARGQFSEVFLKLKDVGSGRMTVRPSPIEYWLATTKSEDREIMEAYMKQGYSLDRTLKLLTAKQK